MTQRNTLATFIIMIFSIPLWIGCDSTPDTNASKPAASLTAANAWIRISPEAPYAAYLTIRNNTDGKRHLLSVTSPVFAAIEIHQNTYENGFARMRHVERLKLPANSLTTLDPGGYHLMLFRPDPALDQSTPLQLTLQFDHNQSQTISATWLAHPPTHGENRS